MTNTNTNTNTNTKNKTKAVKVPVELIFLLEKRGMGLPPGEVLLQLCIDYERAEEILSHIADKNVSKDTLWLSKALETFLNSEHQELKSLQKSQDDLKDMFRGMQKFFQIAKT